MSDAVACWKAFVSATAAGHGAYGKECERLSAFGMTEVVETHFVEATEVRARRFRSPQKKNLSLATQYHFLLFKKYVSY